jgi:hypothetical protein
MKFCLALLLTELACLTQLRVRVCKNQNSDTAMNLIAYAPFVFFIGYYYVKCKQWITIL